MEFDALLQWINTNSRLGRVEQPAELEQPIKSKFNTLPTLTGVLESHFIVPVIAYNSNSLRLRFNRFKSTRQ